MFRKQHSLSKQLAVAVALALGASGVALADGNSMSRFGGDSYAYFNRPVPRTAADPAWRQSHPIGLTDAELQALSSSALAASEFGLDHPVVASVPADPSWRQSHPNGMTAREMLAFSSSTLSPWHLPNAGYTALSATANVAQKPGNETLSARLAKFFRADGGTRVDTN